MQCTMHAAYWHIEIVIRARPGKARANRVRYLQREALFVGGCAGRGRQPLRGSELQGRSQNVKSNKIFLYAI